MPKDRGYAARSSALVAVALTSFGVAACTTLGPMPATTAVTAMSPGRPDVDVQFGAVPGYYLSSSVQRSPKGAAMQQASAVFDPDDWIAVPGLFVGIRGVGNSDSGAYGEPMLGYRRNLGDDRRVGLGGVAYGTYTKDSRNQASYSATRLGGEVATDVRLTPSSKWIELHMLGSASLTGVDASGKYCLDSNGIYGVDCPQTPVTLANASAGGIYPALTLGIGLDTGQNIESAFHGVRLAFYGSAGTQPRVVKAAQTSAQLYGAAGLTIDVALGASRAPH